MTILLIILIGLGVYFFASIIGGELEEQRRHDLEAKRWREECADFERRMAEVDALWPTSTDLKARPVDEEQA